MSERSVAPGRHYEALVQAAGILVLVVVAVWTYQRGFGDVRYQLADLKDDPLYLRGPWFTVVGGIIVSALIGVSVAVRGLIVGRSRPPAPPTSQRWFRWHWWWLLVAGWGGYLAGGAVALASGGPVFHPGTMVLELGAPLGITTEVPATCKAAPGQPRMIVSVGGDGRGLPYLQTADEVTGAPVRWPVPGSVNFERVQGSPPDDVAAPGLPDRRPILMLSSGGTAGTAPGLFIVATPLSFFRAYHYRPIDGSGSEGAGTARFEAIAVT